MNLYFCDCCNAPMCNVTHYRADSTSAGCETDACVLCSNSMFGPTADELVEEIDALGEHISETGVDKRIIALSNVLTEMDARERRRDDERYPRSAEIDRKHGF